MHSCSCGLQFDTARGLRAHRRSSSHLNFSADVSQEHDQDDKGRSGSVHVHQDYQSPHGNLINPDSHHSVEAKDFGAFFNHSAATSPPNRLNQRKKPLRLPPDSSAWQQLENELYDFMPAEFSDSLLNSLPSSQVMAKFEDCLYDFIAQRVPQEPPKQQHRKNGPRSTKVSQLYQKLHDTRRLKRIHHKYVAQLKKQQLFHGNTARQVSARWRKLLRQATRIRKKLNRSLGADKERRENNRFRKDPYGYANKLFNSKAERKCSITKQACDQYFPNLYQDRNRSHAYKMMQGMQRPPEPTAPLKLKKPTEHEFRRAVMSKRNAATPGRDGIGYLVYKKLPTAFKTLYRIICHLWNRDIPASWSQAAVVLIYKDGDEADPQNYRPIALTNCAGKIYFSIWASRLQHYMKSNMYFRRDKQKGFLSDIAGCTEHSTLLKSALKDAHSNQRQIVVSWIDLKNAFGSVSHNLIQFALRWYHLPEQFCNIMFMYYDSLFATIEQADWCSEIFTYEIGVFQGCVISPLLFDTTFNLLLDLLLPHTATRGYKLKSTDLTVHDLAYADDLTIVSKNRQFNQQSLELIDKFLHWTRTMASKPQKCRSLAYKFWSKNDDASGLKRHRPTRYAPFDPQLRIAGQPVEFIADQPFKFLGWKVFYHLKEHTQKEEVEAAFRKKMEIANAACIHGFMKMWLYQHYIVTSLAWPFMTYDFDVSWVQNLQTYATKMLKKWAGLHRSTITSILYRPREHFGLQLHSLEHYYKKLQVNKMHQLKYSSDTDMNKLFTMLLSQQSEFTRIWKPAPHLEENQARLAFNMKFQGQTDRKGLGFVIGRYANKLTKQQDKERTLQLLKDSLVGELLIEDIDKPMQGLYHRLTGVDGFDFSWNHLIHTRNPKLISWVLNASTNSVVTPDLRKIWGIQPTAQCPLCQHPQASLTHILVGCTKALTQHRYSWRHDSVLVNLQKALHQHIARHNKNHLCSTQATLGQTALYPIKFVRPVTVNHKTRFSPPTRQTKAQRVSLLNGASDWNVQVDFTHNNVPFPVCICVTDERPDIVIWSPSTKTVILVELTCPAEENIRDAQHRKTSKYAGLVGQIRDNNWTCHFFTIEVGARGFVASSLPHCLRNLGFSNSNTKIACQVASRSAARCSYYIYKSHRVLQWTLRLPVELDLVQS